MLDKICDACLAAEGALILAIALYLLSPFRWVRVIYWSFYLIGGIVFLELGIIRERIIPPKSTMIGRFKEWITGKIANWLSARWLNWHFDGHQINRHNESKL
jgi:hypothetical protein